LQWFGVLRQERIGLFVALTALSVSTILQTGWLWWRSRLILRAHEGAMAGHQHVVEDVALPEIEGARL